MARSTYRISQQAAEDLAEIEEYVSKKSPAASVLILDQLLKTFDFLAENATAGELRNDLFPSVRMFVPRKPAHNYVILYHQLPNGIEVNHVVHSARNWEVSFLRGNE